MNVSANQNRRLARERRLVAAVARSKREYDRALKRLANFYERHGGNK